MVLSRMVNVPTLIIPPPLSVVLPQAVLLTMVQVLTFSVAEFQVKIPPPSPLPTVAPPKPATALFAANVEQDTFAEPSRYSPPPRPLLPNPAEGAEPPR